MMNPKGIVVGVAIAVAALTSSTASFAESPKLEINKAATENKVALKPPLPAYACGLFSCDYLVERVNPFRRDPQGYCRQKYGGSAFVHRVWGIPFCALPYNPRSVA
jgi:hypothetical protein